MRDYREAPLDPPTRALLDYAVQLTLHPQQMTQADVARLRDHGFSDEEILNANLVASYFNFINRVADGLGVDPEPEMEGKPPPPPWSAA